MPRFEINFKYPIQHEDNLAFKEFISLKAKLSKHLRNLKFSSAYEGGFSFTGKCDIRYCCTTIKNKFTIDSLYSKECSPGQQEWTSDEFNEFKSIVQSYFTEITVILD